MDINEHLFDLIVQYMDTFDSKFKFLMLCDMRYVHVIHRYCVVDFDKLDHNKYGNNIRCIKNIRSYNDLKRFHNLLEVYFHDEFNEDVDSSCTSLYPLKVTKIVFGGNFNKKIRSDMFPKTLKHLEFGHFYNQVLGRSAFPQNLEVFVSGINRFAMNLYLPPGTNWIIKSI
jgi:hypothetical protein